MGEVAQMLEQAPSNMKVRVQIPIREFFSIFDYTNHSYNMSTYVKLGPHRRQVGQETILFVITSFDPFKF